jgi:hypothetical protein
METRERSGATVEKDALLFLRLLTALLERRVTPRLVNIVNYDDDSNDEEVKVSESAKRTISEIKFRFNRRACFPEFIRFSNHIEIYIDYATPLYSVTNAPLTAMARPEVDHNRFPLALRCHAWSPIY